MVALTVLGALAVALGYWTLTSEAAPSLLASRLGEYAEPDPIDLDDAELSLPLSQRVLAPLMARVSAFMLRHTKSGQLQQVRLLLIQSGSSMKAEYLLALKLMLLPVGAVLGFGLATALNLGSTPQMAIPVGGGILGYFYPSSRLKGKAKKRAKELQRALPGVLDLMTISMEAGLSLDMALMRITEYETSTLATEFAKVIHEIRLGRPRGEALNAMADRNGVDELTVIIRAIVQAEPLGVGVANVLRIQSEELRRIRKQRAEEKGHKAPVKMLLPMMGCIFPCIFIILLGPALLTVVDSVSGGGKG
jgi:tight adherence protein C